MDEMKRALVAVMNQRVVALDGFDIGSLLGQFGDVRIVLPQLTGGCADISQKPAGMTFVKFPHRSSQHHDVTGGQIIAKNHLSHYIAKSFAHSSITLIAYIQRNGHQRSQSCDFDLNPGLYKLSLSWTLGPSPRLGGFVKNMTFITPLSAHRHFPSTESWLSLAEKKVQIISLLQRHFPFEA